MRGFPEWGTVSLIEPSPFDAGTAYVVVDAHRLDDMRPYLYKTTDYGKTWKSLFMSDLVESACDRSVTAARSRSIPNQVLSQVETAWQSGHATR